jgi:hypothetical protein
VFQLLETWRELDLVRDKDKKTEGKEGNRGTHMREASSSPPGLVPYIFQTRSRNLLFFWLILYFSREGGFSYYSVFSSQKPI